jgi:hypothetical protein
MGHGARSQEHARIRQTAETSPAKREGTGHGAWSQEHARIRQTAETSPAKREGTGHGARRISQQKIGEDRGEWYFRNGV